MRVADLRTLYDYNEWANERILGTATALTVEQFTAPTRFPHRSLRGTLVHILTAERIWHVVCQGQARPPALSEDDYADLATLWEHYRREAAAMRAYLATLADADLDQPVDFTFRSRNATLTSARWQCLIHVVTHGTQHRSEAAQMLTEFGHSPGDFDLCLWPLLRGDQSTLRLDAVAHRPTILAAGSPRRDHP